jgi:hypothetical protein
MSESLLDIPSIGFITILKPNTSVYYIITYLKQEYYLQHDLLFLENVDDGVLEAALV